MSSLSSDINLDLRIEAEKIRISGDYSNAAEKFYQAAQYAKNELRNQFIMQTLLVEHNLCICSIDERIDVRAIDNLLDSINELMNVNDDDRNYGLKAITNLYTAIKFYLNQDYVSLEKMRANKNDAWKKNSLSETMTIFIIELGMLKNKLGNKNINLTAFNKELKKLSGKLKLAINESNLSPGLKNKLISATVFVTGQKKKRL